MAANISHLPPGKERLKEYRREQKTDPLCSTLRQYCQEGWPDNNTLTPHLKLYWPERGNLTIGEDLLLHGSRVVIPASLQAQTLQKLHQGHQGIQRCRLRANTAVWWPAISRQINDFINRCPQCYRDAPPRREPLITTPLPDFPWQKAATDLFEMRGNTYLLVVDYFSRFPEVQQLRSTTSRSVISALKGRHGVPETLMSDNGVSAEFTEFARAYGFCHTTSSPHYPQANGLVERTVKTIKRTNYSRCSPTEPHPYRGVASLLLSSASVDH